MVAVWVVAGLVLAIGFVLAIPIVVAAHVQWAGGWTGRVRVRWLFGLVDVDSSRASPRQNPPPPRPIEARARPTRRRRGSRMLLAGLRSEGAVRRVGTLLVRLFQQIRPDDAHVRLEFGFSDPADTGSLCGLMAPWAWVLAVPRGMQVQCIPDFERARFAAAGAGTFHIRPLGVLGVVVAFVCSPAILRAAVAVWRSR